MGFGKGIRHFVIVHRSRGPGCIPVSSLEPNLNYNRSELAKGLYSWIDDRYLVLIGAAGIDPPYGIGIRG